MTDHDERCKFCGQLHDQVPEDLCPAARREWDHATGLLRELEGPGTHTRVTPMLRRGLFDRGGARCVTVHRPFTEGETKKESDSPTEAYAQAIRDHRELGCFIILDRQQDEVQDCRSYHWTLGARS